MSPRPRRGEAPGREFPRPSGVVRVLLHRPFLATVGALLFTAANGCVVPIGPEFHDKPPPEKIPAIRPILVSADPTFLETVVLDANAGRPFSVQVADPNPEDYISVRWVLNYPPFGETTTILGTFSQAPGEHIPFPFILTCETVKPFPAADRHLSVIASDNGFYASPEKLSDMRSRLNYDADGKYLSGINGWSLAGCP